MQRASAETARAHLPVRTKKPRQKSSSRSEARWARKVVFGDVAVFTVGRCSTTNDPRRRQVGEARWAGKALFGG
eukprot:9668048-Alexandrium_andersonii.AAC.1